MRDGLFLSRRRGETGSAVELKIPAMLVSGRPDLEQIAGRMGTPYFLAKGAKRQKSLDVLDRALRERLAPFTA